MRNYARIDDGIVVELFKTDLDITTIFHPDMLWIDITDLEVRPAEGWTFEADRFAEPVAPVPSEAELAQQAMAKRDALLALADEATAGMADAYIVDLLNEADTATFRGYAAYKLKLNKIDEQPGYPSAIDWPTLPA